MIGRRASVAVLLAFGVVGAGTLSACGTNPKADADALRTALHRSATPAHSFIYREATTDRKVTVRGVVSDDYRYKARVVLDGVDVEDEVVSDDALAVRFVEPSAVDLFLSQSSAATAAADSPAAIAGPAATVVAGAAGSGAGAASAAPQAVANLRARRWVTDPVGAPELTLGAVKHTVGDDPVLDALTALNYVEEAMGQAQSVSRFNPESLDYVAREDKFPKPNGHSGVVRYDLRPRRIVRPTAGGPGGGLPDTGNFRRLSVYVKDGLVIKVLEDIDILTPLDRLVSSYGIKLPKGISQAEAARGAIAAVNRQRKLQGSDPIRVRQMSLELLDSGKAQQVHLPTDAVEADLSLLRNRGRAANTATAQGKVVTPNP